jgi:hypothetical protein
MWIGQGNPKMAGGYKFVQQILNFGIQFFGGFDSAIDTLRMNRLFKRS